MSKVVYLFPDTNLFIQCKPLHEIDWSPWASYDEIHLIVTDPVQSEIDKFKDQSGSRRQKKARNTSSFFGKILEEDQGYILIEHKQYTIKLYLELLLQYSDKPLNLDLNKKDDQILSVAKMFAAERYSEDVIFVSKDNGPLVKAKSINLKYYKIPDTWALPPETDEKDKQIKKLESELERLTQLKPKVEFKTESIITKYKKYTKIPDELIESLVQSLKVKFPEKETFNEITNNSSYPVLRASIASGLLGNISEEQIEKYRNEYSSWLNSCREFLENLHEKLKCNKRFPIGSISLENSGGVPANNVAVRFIPQGKIRLVRYRNEEDDRTEIKLPSPPKPPKPATILGSVLDFESLHYSNQLMPYMPKPHDPHDFYWQSSKTDIGAGKLELSCDQWRHSDTEELFEFRIQFDLSQSQTKSSIQVEVHAENISVPARKIVPVTIDVEEVNCYDKAQLLIQELR